MSFIVYLQFRLNQLIAKKTQTNGSK